MSGSTSLICLLCEAGVHVVKARHFAKHVERLRINSWSADDLAGILLDWANARTLHRLLEQQETIDKLTGYPESPGLFDELAIGGTQAAVG